MSPISRKPMRVGAVNYLNSKPLIEGLTELAPGAELVLDYPSRLAQDLRSGRLDVALVPSIACLMEPCYEVVSDACVAARGPVLSVKLYMRVPPEKIRCLALDEGSRTSAALARILLAERCRALPEVEPLPLDCDTQATSADAVLLIGDRAIHPPRERFCCTWDLGQEWRNWTGLPFVFALWATRAGTDLGPVEDALTEARDLGVSRLDEIAQREAPKLGLSERVAREYLTHNLHYHLQAHERQGLLRFQQLAVRHGLVPQEFDLVFRHFAAA
ncbi:MAG: menaquinone biosynthetic enzyme MqnA/MqnD family protein [Planctomycetaceae bacterium]